MVDCTGVVTVKHLESFLNLLIRHLDGVADHLQELLELHRPTSVLVRSFDHPLRIWCYGISGTGNQAYFRSSWVLSPHYSPQQRHHWLGAPLSSSPLLAPVQIFQNWGKFRINIVMWKLIWRHPLIRLIIQQPRLRRFDTLELIVPSPSLSNRAKALLISCQIIKHFIYFQGKSWKRVSHLSASSPGCR